MELLGPIQDMLSGVLNVNVIIALVTITVVIVYSYSGTPKNLPPGPIGLPIVGYLPFMNKKPHLTFNKLAKKYGPVFSLYLGNRLIIVLNNYDAIKEAFVKQGEVFAGRPDLQMALIDKTDYSIPLANGDMWKVHRRFALNVFRDLGVGKMSIEPQIMEEIQYFVNEVKKPDGRAASFSKQLTASVSNNICILIFGKRFEYDDPWFVSARSLVHEFAVTASTLGVVNFLPWLLKVPGIEKILDQGKLIEMTKVFKEEMYSRITESKKHYTDGQRDCYFNAFIGEQKALEKKEKLNTIFPDKALEENVRAIMGAGTETTTNTLLWCILYMVTYPAVQKRVQKELDDVIGSERAPCWNDRLRTPYTEATLNEVQRISTLLPNNLPHKYVQPMHKVNEMTFSADVDEFNIEYSLNICFTRNSKECELFGYTIPKDTFIVSNLWAVHNDDKLWNNPEAFRPERFLNANGALDKNEHLIPFSIGKRECLGISLAKMELYLYFATLLQKFTFKSPDGLKPNMEPRIGFTYGPKYFNIIAEINNKSTT